MIYPRKYIRTIKLGIKNLLMHKMRAALTMLGIIFGVCSVIAMLAIGEGASHEAQQQIKDLGVNNIILRSIKPPEDSQTSSQGKSYSIEYGLTYLDADRIARSVPGVEIVLPKRIILEDAYFGRNKQQCRVIGTLPNYGHLKQLAMARGRFLADNDHEQGENICVLSGRLAYNMFGYQDPLQHTIRIKGNYYRVVGVIEEPELQMRKGTAAEEAVRAWEHEVFIPLSTVKARFGETITRRTSGSSSSEKVELHEIIIQMQDPKQVEEAAEAIEQILKRFHTKRDYEKDVPLQLLLQAEKTKRIFNIVLGSIAAISLLVGGIGIMNIMLATVTERTREIGIRRALGARKKDIVVQFLVETIVLSIGGGLIGVALGVAIPYLVSELTSIATIITPWSLIVAFSISGIIGMVFGIYPATRAANLDPIEALRHE